MVCGAKLFITAGFPRRHYRKGMAAVWEETPNMLHRYNQHHAFYTQAVQGLIAAVHVTAKHHTKCGEAIMNFATGLLAGGSSMPQPLPMTEVSKCVHLHGR